MRTRVMLPAAVAAAVFWAAAGPQPVVITATSAAQATLTRSSEIVHVDSADGTRIAVECAGTGPTLLFVHGGVGDRQRWTPMFSQLASRFRTCAMDRRGRGESGDGPEYSLTREAEDVAAVANASRAPVYVFGHSFGAVVALEAAFLTDRIARLMLYEPPLHEPVEANLEMAARLEGMVEAGELERALITFQRDIVQQPAEELVRMQSRPSWAAMVASMRAQPRQMRALAASPFQPDKMRALTVPTLLLLGEDTISPFARQSIAALRQTLPSATLVLLEGQGHNAADSGQTLLGDVIVRFVMP